MKNSIAILDVNAKDGVVAISKIMRDDPENVTVKTADYDYSMPVQCALMGAVNSILDELHESAQKDPSIKGRYTIMVPETVAYRFFQAQGCVNKGQDITSALYLPWMQAETYNRTATIINDNGEEEVVEYNIWESTISAMSDLLNIMLDKTSGWSINFVNARTLYRYELRSADGTPIDQLIDKGTVVNVVNSYDQDRKVICTENNILNGQFVVSRTDVRDRQGNVTPHFYIPRVIPVRTVEGTNSLMTIGELMMPQNDGVTPVNANHVHFFNAAFLRTKTAEVLPRVKMAKTATVTNVSTNGKLF